MGGEAAKNKYARCNLKTGISSPPIIFGPFSHNDWSQGLDVHLIFEFPGLCMGESCKGRWLAPCYRNVACVLWGLLKWAHYMIRYTSLCTPLPPCTSFCFSDFIIKFSSRDKKNHDRSYYYLLAICKACLMSKQIHAQPVLFKVSQMKIITCVFVMPISQPDSGVPLLHIAAASFPSHVC